MGNLVTRYTIEYYTSVDDEGRWTDYIYADSYEEAMVAFEERHGTDCVVTMCEPIEVPARYKRYDEEAAAQANNQGVDAVLKDAQDRSALTGLGHTEKDCFGLS